MDWKRGFTGLLAIAMASTLVFSIAPSGLVRAAAEDDAIKVSTDFQLLGAQDLHGGGHLTYTLTGAAAVDLRQRVSIHYDIDRNGISTTELNNYIKGNLEIVLERGTAFFAGSTKAYAPLHDASQEIITTDAEGFVDVADLNDTYTAINIYLYFDAYQIAKQGLDVKLVELRLFDALYLPIATGGYVLTNTWTGETGPWRGTYIYSHTDYRVSLTSFSNTRVSAGDVYVFRTPAGSITKYDVTFNSENDFTPDERATYSSFDFLENPQILFIVLFVFGYFTSSFPSREWANFKLSHPRRYRHKAKKITWIHILSKVFIVLMLIFYFVPNLFMLFGSSLYLSGIVIWVMGIIGVVLMAVLSKKYYEKAMSTIPDEPAVVVPKPVAAPQPSAPAAGQVQVVVQQPHQQASAPSGPPCGMCRKSIDDHGDMTKCACGKVYHPACIQGVKACPFCTTPFLGNVKMKDVQCPTCAEVNKISEDANLMSSKCKACGTLLAKIEPGYNYLVISKDRSTIYNIMVNLLKTNKMVGLCITSTFPEKIKKEYDLKNTDVVWVSDTTGDPTILNPKRLEFETMRTIGNFLKGRPNAILMLDGFEYLIVENGFEKVLKFIKKINDLSSVNHATFLVPMGGDSITPEQIGILRKEFDKVIEVGGAPPSA